jgi:hypothetical protein
MPIIELPDDDDQADHQAAARATARKARELLKHAGREDASRIRTVTHGSQVAFDVPDDLAPQAAQRRGDGGGKAKAGSGKESGK